MNRAGRSCVALAVCGLALGTGRVAGARVPAQWKNCDAVNARYPHGIGKLGARDRTSGEPVTNFRRSTPLYRLAIGYNAGLDRDKDGIACESR
jgi:Excalibur calcium-binding domain